MNKIILILPVMSVSLIFSSARAQVPATDGQKIERYQRLLAETKDLKTRHDEILLKIEETNLALESAKLKCTSVCKSPQLQNTLVGLQSLGTAIVAVSGYFPALMWLTAKVAEEAPTYFFPLNWYVKSAIAGVVVVSAAGIIESKLTSAQEAITRKDIEDLQKNLAQYRLELSATQKLLEIATKALGQSILLIQNNV